MSDQLPTPATVYPSLPPVAVCGRALAQFTVEMAGHLRELEQRFAAPRKHPRLSSGEARGANRRPR